MKLPGLKSRVSFGLPGFAGLPTLRSGRHSSPGLKAWGFLAGFITGQLEVDLTHSRPFVRHSCASRACPALDAGNPCFLDTGSLFSQGQAWIPVFTGMTNLMLYCSDAHGRPHSNPVRDMSRRIGRPFCKFSFASRRGVSTIPEGDTKHYTSELIRSAHSILPLYDSPLCTPLHAWREKPSNRYSEVSEYQLQPETEDSRCLHVFPVERDESYPIDNLLLTRPNDLYVRRQLHPRRNGNIIESLEPILIPQK